MLKSGKWWVRLLLAVWIGWLALVSGEGCKSGPGTFGTVETLTMPSELKMVSLPEYTIAPPDILLIDAVRLVPRPPYHIAPLDALLIQVTAFGAKDEKGKDTNLLPNQPIAGLYRVEPEGTVSLGFDYGAVAVVGKTIPQAKEEIRAFLAKRFKTEFDLVVELGEARAMQQIRGEHLVQPDGKITLGTYGRVYVAGLTLAEARNAIQSHLAETLLNPEISIDMAGFNSKVYYVIYNLDGAGEAITRLPMTGSETVLDALAELKGLPAGTSRFRIWLARPSPGAAECRQVLPVDYMAITRGGSTETNYQLLPGDRLFVGVDPWVVMDGYLAKVTSPIERVFGGLLLGNSTVRTFRSGFGTGTGTGIPTIP